MPRRTCGVLRIIFPLWVFELDLLPCSSVLLILDVFTVCANHRFFGKTMPIPEIHMRGQRMLVAVLNRGRDHQYLQHVNGCHRGPVKETRHPLDRFFFLRLMAYASLQGLVITGPQPIGKMHCCLHLPGGKLAHILQNGPLLLTMTLLTVLAVLKRRCELLQQIQWEFAAFTNCRLQRRLALLVLCIQLRTVLQQCQDYILQTQFGLLFLK
mmetsp:Transcript_46734/g.123508  ORF Transcript_46734/g.123508 Transcript_46734/m.123508 type:complete len:211 (-) Transcript_46734:575-1207(-)